MSETEMELKRLAAKVHGLLEEGSGLDGWEKHRFASRAFAATFGVSRDNTGMNHLGEAQMRELVQVLAAALPALELTVALLQTRDGGARR